MNYYYNIEPFHFANEDIVTITPNIESFLSSITLSQKRDNFLFAILLDDTNTPGKPVEEELIKKIVLLQKIHPCVMLLETSLTPITLALMELIGWQNLIFTKRDIRLININNSKKSQLLFRSKYDGFDCRKLNQTSNSYLSDEFCDLVKPTCVFYTVAWYYFRLLSPKKELISLLNLHYSENTVKKAMRKFASHLKLDNLKREAILITNLPIVYKPNEKKENNISQKTSLKEGWHINATNLHNHFYY